jgi:hypothetical protein
LIYTSILSTDANVPLSNTSGTADCTYLNFTSWITRTNIICPDLIWFFKKAEVTDLPPTDKSVHGLRRNQGKLVKPISTAVSFGHNGRRGSI